jgi:TolA-binding protein
MKNWARPWKIFLCTVVCATGLGAHCGAQGVGQAEGLAAQALELLNAGKLDDAANLYSQIISTYPNSDVTPEAYFRLGYIEYLQGNYDQAVDTLKRIENSGATPGVRVAGESLIPQVLEEKAAKMAADDPQRDATLQDVVHQYTTIIRAYPNTAEVESAKYGRARALLELGQDSAAEQNLRENLAQFASSDTILDSQDLLAVVLTTEASKSLREHENERAAMDKYKEALGYLADIIERGTDASLANDAQFQIGEVLFNRGNTEQGEAREKDLENAIIAYRAVQPRDAMVRAQQTRVAEIEQRRNQAAAQGELDEVQNLQRLEDSVNAKLGALKVSPDQTINADLRIAACYYLLGRYDEARVLLQYLTPFAETDDQKKQISYYTILTYAAQGVTDKATAAFDDFQSKYSGDPLGESLPLAMGAAFLNPKVDQPQKAIAFFGEELSLYPKSPLVNQALSQQAAALISLKEYDQALDTYKQFLQSNPSPSQAAAAREGIATIYRETGKLADAIKQYQSVAETYAGTPEADESAFYAAGLETSVDPKAALSMLQAYLQKYPDGKFAPQATMLTGEMDAALGDPSAALAAYKSAAEKYPDSDIASQAYFQQAALLGTEQKMDEMIAVLRQFIAAYPNDKDIFYAYDTIGQTQAGKGQVADAIATYSEMVEKHSDNPMAASAQYRVAELSEKEAEGMGQYTGLKPAQRKHWSAEIGVSVAAIEKMLDQFPNSDQLGLALETLLADQQMLLDAKLKTPREIDNYLRGLAGKYNSDASARSRILFALATFTYQKDPAKAIADMTAAYDPSLVYAPDDLDLYGSALIDQGKPDQAYAVYSKIAKDFPTPPGVQPTLAQPAIQEAQATALFGMARALEKEGNIAQAGKLYGQLKTLYPWSPKVVEANYGIAKSLVDGGKFDDALKLLIAIVANRNASAQLRARAFLLIGDAQQDKGNLPAAIDSYLKTAVYYAGVPDVAAQGLWKGAQLLEKQAATLSDQTTPKKSEQINKAVLAYNSIVTKYPNSQFVGPAQARLSALPQAQ